jgi:hypothetical protein
MQDPARRKLLSRFVSGAPVKRTLANVKENPISGHLQC